MAIDKDLIVKLRNASQAGFADCKKALEENNNDLEASIKWLRMKGIAKASSKHAGSEASEGGTWVKKDGNGVVIMELNSETDFTANNSEFLKLAEGIVKSLLENKVVSREDAMKCKMDNGETVEENCLHLSAITGEKIHLKRVKYVGIKPGESIACYRHNNGKMSTFLILEGTFKDEDIAGLAVHYAANNPRFISRDDVDPEWIKEETEVIVANLKRENKPEQFHQRIIEERIKKALSQFSFLDQPYLYDSSKSIRQILDGLGAKVKEAVYYEIGKD